MASIAGIAIPVSARPPRQSLQVSIAFGLVFAYCLAWGFFIGSLFLPCGIIEPCGSLLFVQLYMCFCFDSVDPIMLSKNLSFFLSLRDLNGSSEKHLDWYRLLFDSFNFSPYIFLRPYILLSLLCLCNLLCFYLYFNRWPFASACSFYSSYLNVDVIISNIQWFFNKCEERIAFWAPFWTFHLKWFSVSAHQVCLFHDQATTVTLARRVSRWSPSQHSCKPPLWQNYCHRLLLITRSPYHVQPLSQPTFWTVVPFALAKNGVDAFLTLPGIIAWPTCSHHGRIAELNQIFTWFFQQMRMSVALRASLVCLFVDINYSHTWRTCRPSELCKYLWSFM